MAIPLRVVSEQNRPATRQFAASDNLQIDVVVRRAGSGAMTIGSNLSAAQATGSIAVSAVPSAGDTITIDGVALTAVSGARTSGSDDFSVDSGTTGGIAAEIEAAINDPSNSFTSIVTASVSGSAVDLTAVPLNAAGNSITLETSNETAFTLSGDTLTGGSDPGELHLGTSTTDTRVLGDLVVDGSSTISLNETVIGSFTVEGDVNLGDNTGDTINLGGGAGDTVNLNADLVLGAGLVSIGSSLSDYASEIWLQAVNDSGPDADAYSLNVSSTSAGAYAIGVDPSIVTSSSATDLMTMLSDLDSAATSVEGLQATYEAGNTIDATSPEGAVELRNDTLGDTTTVLIVGRSPSGFTGGDGLAVDLNANTTGSAVRVTSAGSGPALFVNHSGTGDVLDVQDSGASVLRVTGTGAVEVLPTTGESVTVAAAGSGSVDIDSATGAITLDSTGAGISLDAAAASNFSTSAGNLTLSAAAELAFDDVGGSGLELSQASDRTLAQTGVGEIYETATSLVGALNAVARALEVAGLFSAELPVEDGVTISEGDVVAASTMGGRITQGSAGSGGNKAIMGIALSGGTGDSGGTVSVKFALASSLVTIPGGSFTPGTPIFAPVSPGPPADSFGGGDGDRNLRLGYAVSSDLVVFQPSSGFTL